jgi:predicted secreted hydrolase
VSASSWIRSHKKSSAIIAGALVATFGVGTSMASGATPEHGGTASPVGSHPAAPDRAPGYPTFVHLPADQAAHPNATTEWWYTVGHLSSHGHKYGYEVVIGDMAQIAITDITTGAYYSQNVTYKPGQVSQSSTSLDVRSPDVTLSGPMNAMRLTAKLPDGHGSLDLTLDAKGPAMYGNGTGLFPFLGGSTYYYSLPNVTTAGTLTVNGRTSTVAGTSWLDRQYGDWDWKQLHKWTWMAVQLDNGDAVNLWDLFDTKGENHWATVLHRDGSESVVSVNPLAKNATDFRTSPTTGQRYAGKWTVEIPGLHTSLVVTAQPVLQEVQAGLPFTPGINEAASTVTGTYQGKPVTGQAYVEQFGIWK